MKNLVKNIIFDLGGVLLNLDFSASLREFKKLGIHNFEELYSKGQQLDLFNDFETGKISPLEFRNKVRALTKVELSDNAIDHAWNSILLDFSNENKQLLYDLKPNYRLFLLSNTNEIHISSFENNLVKEHGNNFLLDVFDKIYFSCRMNLRKPNADIFDFVLKENGLTISETIFIDDSIQHVEGAIGAGLKAYWLDLSKNNTIHMVRNELGL